MCPTSRAFSVSPADVHTMLAKQKVTETPVAFFGHSMGGLIAFEVARKFEEAGAPVAALFLSASPAPGHGGYEELQGSDSELLDMVNQMTGSGGQLIEGKFGETVLRTLRNYGAITKYTVPAGHHRLLPPFTPTPRPTTTLSPMREWRRGRSSPLRSSR